MSYVLFLFWLALLIKWADFFVDWASGIARKLWVSPLLTGLTIVAMGTSAPELFININAALQWHTDLAMGNIVGSNISNIMLIGWIGALCWWMFLDKVIIKNFYISLSFAILLWLVSFEWVSGVAGIWYIGWVICLLARVCYMYYMVRTKEVQDPEITDTKVRSIPLLLWMILVWLLWLFYGSDMVIVNVLSMGAAFWISERIMGLVVVAIGTSLPELVTTIIAVRKWQCALGIGNVVGSNIFNIGLIGWLTAIVHPVVFSPQTYRDLRALLLFTVLFIGLSYIQPRYKITPLQWVLLIIVYIMYIAYSILS